MNLIFKKQHRDRCSDSGTELLEDYAESFWEQMMDLNFEGVLLYRGRVGAFKESGSGSSVIKVCSMYGILFGRDEQSGKNFLEPGTTALDLYSTLKEAYMSVDSEGT